MSSFFICKVIHIIMMILISMVTNLEGNKHHCYFIPCKYAYALKRPSNSEAAIKHLQFKKKRFFSFCFQGKRWRRISPDWSPWESLINFLGNLFQGYQINQNFMAKKKNKQWKPCYFGAEKKEIYMIFFSILRSDLQFDNRVWELYGSHFPTSALLK